MFLSKLNLHDHPQHSFWQNKLKYDNLGRLIPNKFKAAQSSNSSKWIDFPIQ